MLQKFSWHMFVIRSPVESSFCHNVTIFWDNECPIIIVVSSCVITLFIKLLGPLSPLAHIHTHTHTWIHTHTHTHTHSLAHTHTHTHFHRDMGPVLSYPTPYIYLNNEVVLIELITIRSRVRGSKLTSIIRNSSKLCSQYRSWIRNKTFCFIPSKFGC